MRTFVLTLVSFFLLAGSMRAGDLSVSGRVIDSQAYPIPQANVQLIQGSATALQTQTDHDGRFEFHVNNLGEGVLKVEVQGFDPVTKTLTVAVGLPSFDVRMEKLSARNEIITVTANVDETSLNAPDPGQRVIVRQDMLDANPGRPGAPVSIPGMPIETASGGIKAPQYFVPGVAGDHGEPIAQYIQVGTFLCQTTYAPMPTGTGTPTPTSWCRQAIDSVQADGGAFNVCEGNHASTSARAYGLRQKLEPFVTLTADYRDVDIGGFSLRVRMSAPVVSGGLRKRLAGHTGTPPAVQDERARKTDSLRHHESDVFLGYYGIPGFRACIPSEFPVCMTPSIRGRRIRPTPPTRGERCVAAGSGQRFDFSGFFRTYNLALYSNFGDGLIRQSEFRTVTGGNSTYISQLNDYLSCLQESIMFAMPRDG